MDSNFASAASALAGAVVGGMASLGSSWVTQWIQVRDRNAAADRARREALFAEFIDEASRLYGDALSHEKDDVSDLVRLYALVARIRLVASDGVVHAAEGTMSAIIETYLAPNRSLHELSVRAGAGDLNFLLDFGVACRAELGGLSRLPR
jgi:hypothetical protein